MVFDSLQPATAFTFPDLGERVAVGGGGYIWVSGLRLGPVYGSKGVTDGPWFISGSELGLGMVYVWTPGLYLGLLLGLGEFHAWAWFTTMGVYS